MSNTVWKRRRGSFSLPTLLAIVLIAALTTVLFLPRIEASDFPREGIAEVPNGVPEPFVGLWSVGFPEGEGMINGAPIATCAAPVALNGSGNGTLTYLSPTGDEVAFELSAFSSRTTWLPAMGESLVAVWISIDEFYLYSVDLTTGRARWDNPHAYRRCV